MWLEFFLRKTKRTPIAALLELSFASYRGHNRNVNAPHTTGLDQPKAKLKQTTACTVAFISQKLALVLFTTSILAVLALSGCEQKTETTEPHPSPSKPLETPTEQPTIAKSPTTEASPDLSATSYAHMLDIIRSQNQFFNQQNSYNQRGHLSSSHDTGREADERGLEDQDVVPKFPWPPPKWSASDTIPRELLVGNAAHPTFSTVAQAIESAFQEAGYGEKSYYSVADGFAMASQIEQINQDGSPKESFDRWSSQTPPLRKFSLGSYLNALFTAQPGYYRVIVFVVTSQAFRESDDVKATSETSKEWVSGGLNRLPEKIGNQEYSLAHSCTALIYEFKQTGKHAELVDPSQITGKTHLDKAGLMAAFAKSR